MNLSLTRSLGEWLISMDDRKHSGSVYRTSSGGVPVSDGRGGSGQRYMGSSGGGGRSGGRDSRRPREREGREQRMRSNRGRVREILI